MSDDAADAIGKVDPGTLADSVFGHTGVQDDAVVRGPAYGEDAAVIDLGGEYLVVSTDPISLAVGRLGRLGVDVACNDVAVTGATPRWLTVCVFLPGRDEALDEIARGVDEAARRSEVAVVGGHTEYAPALDRPTLVVTAMGLGGSFVPTGGASPGDRILLTKGAGIEATAILATDFRDRLADVPDDVLDEAATYYDAVSIRAEAAALAPHASAMHDPTEGGVLTGLYELAAAGGVGLDVDVDAVPVRQATARCCAAAGVDPLSVLGSGALLATVPSDAADAAMAAVDDAGVHVADVGRVVEADEPTVLLDDAVVGGPVRDGMYDLWT